MTGDRTNQGRIGTGAPDRAHRMGQAAVLVPLLLLGSVLIAGRTAGADQLDTALPEPTPTAISAERPLSLNLDRVLDESGRGHSEFDLSLRREIWSDPMVRLGFTLGQEQAAARRGGLVGCPAPFTAGIVQVPSPGADLRLVLSGPFAADWQDLSPEERVVRVTETVVYYGLIFEILHELGGRLR